MKFSLDKQHENRIEFEVEGTDTSLANLVRRYCLSRIFVLAIDKVTFYDNNSPFWDEYLSHRLGLLPIITPDKLPKNPEITFVLDAEGPKVVYASELKSSDGEIKIAQDKIVIATLGQNQRLRLECRTNYANARTHAKYQAGLVGYGEEKGKLSFFVESFYQMLPSEVIRRGCDAILSDLESIEDGLKKKKGE